jgi:hypothetical protein
VTFAAGVLTGAIMMREFAGPPHRPPGMGRRYSPERHRALTLEALKNRLNLSETQSQEVQQILAEHQQQLRRHFERMRPQSRRIFEELTKDIENVLTPEQRQKFHEEFPLLWKMPGPPPLAKEDSL